MKKNKENYKFRNKLNNEKGLPKIKLIPQKLHKFWGKGNFVMPSPLEVNALMKRVPKAKLTTINEIRKKLSKKHKTTTACPIVTGIFVWIAAFAAEEELRDGKKRVTPYWRTLKSDGRINQKYPGGISLQKRLLRKEGHKFVPKGKNCFIENFTAKLTKL